jgi:hypothetical protein
MSTDVSFEAGVGSGLATISSSSSNCASIAFVSVSDLVRLRIACRDEYTVPRRTGLRPSSRDGSRDSDTAVTPAAYAA